MSTHRLEQLFRAAIGGIRHHLHPVARSRVPLLGATLGDLANLAVGFHLTPSHQILQQPWRSLGVVAQYQC